MIELGFNKNSFFLILKKVDFTLQAWKETIFLSANSLEHIFFPAFVNLRYADVTLSKAILPLPKAGNSYKQDSVIIENN